MKNDKNWWQIEVEEEIENTTGNDLVLFLNFITQFIEINYVLLDCLDGNMGEFFENLSMPHVLDYSELKENLPSAIQFYFGDFYLFNKQKSIWEFDEKALRIDRNLSFERQMITTSDLYTMIVIFDNTSFIIYTKNYGLVQHLRKQYPKARYENKTLEELEFYG